jgi:hypothetical protein
MVEKSDFHSKESTQIEGGCEKGATGNVQN